MSALRRLSEELQETVTHLNGYLGEQLCEQRLNPAKGSSQPPGCVVAIAGALAEVRDAAAHMSELLTAGDLVMLVAASPVSAERGGRARAMGWWRRSGRAGEQQCLLVAAAPLQ